MKTNSQSQDVDKCFAGGEYTQERDTLRPVDLDEDLGNLSDGSHKSLEWDYQVLKIFWLSFDDVPSVL